MLLLLAVALAGPMEDMVIGALEEEIATLTARQAEIEADLKENPYAGYLKQEFEENKTRIASLTEEIERLRNPPPEPVEAEPVEAEPEPTHQSMPNGFRDHEWGASKPAVLKVEGEPVIAETDRLAYRNRVGGMEMITIYHFLDGALVAARYVSAEEHSNDNKFIDDYETLKELLTRKYGPPTKSDAYWLNDLYRDDYQDWGRAVSVGHHSRYSSWVSDETKLTLALNGDNHDINLTIHYLSQKDQQAVRQADEESLMDGL